ncbi:MAG TPA: hypothetical protein VKR52_07560 [Terracidiphilus sp.]|nr:hypothetical protein [Terracidiphilus sp.]
MTVTRRDSIRAMLAEGRRLDRGRAPAVAEMMLENAQLAGPVIEFLWHENAGVANRAADALERASCWKPEILAPWKDALLGRIIDAEEKKLRWNLALMVGRVPLTKAETERAIPVLRGWLDDKSSIVKACAMEGLAGLARWNEELRREVVDTLRVLSRSGTPAMRARGRILLKKMEKHGG